MTTRTVTNLWLDCGADLPALLGAKTEADLPAALADGVTIGFAVADLARFEASGLVAYLPCVADFARLMKTLRHWDVWEQSLCVLGLTRARLRPYTEHYFRQVWTVRESDMMDDALGLIVDSTTRPPAFLLTPEEFATVLRPPQTLEAGIVGDSAANGHARVEAAVLAKTGRLPQTRSGVSRALRQAELEAEAPDYIRESALPLHVKVALWRADGWGPLPMTIGFPVG